MPISKIPNQGLSDSGLQALGNFNTNGLIVQTADNTFVGRSLVQPASGLQITNSNGVGGNLTFALANDLLALEGLSSNGFAVRTGTDIWTQRTISGTTDNIVISNGDGASGNPTINLPPRLFPVSTAVSDWNSAELNGWYRSSSNTTDLNAPVVGWLIGMTIGEGTGAGAGTQIIWDQIPPSIGNTNMYRRQKNGGVWGSWQKVRFTEAEQGSLGERTVTGTSDTLVLTDINRFVRTTNGSATTITVPLNSSVAFPVGSLIYIEQYGAGQITIAATGGVTIRSSGGKLKIFGQYSGAYLRKIGTDEWMLIGDLAT